MTPKEWLDKFEFSPTDGPEHPERVEELERLIGVRLPPDYRSFLLTIGGGYVRDVLTACTIPTPFAEHNITVLHSIKEIISLLDSVVAPRNMICIGYGHFGRTTCLSMAGLDHGHIFSLDTEMRFYWDDEELSRMPHLAPSIKEFFRLRDEGELPERPWGYDHCYHVADSFMELLSKMHSNA